MDRDLTDNEGALLALVARAGPMTAYQIAAIYEGSPVSNFNTSKGKIYPLVKRLRACGFLDAEPMPGRSTGEQLTCTPAGAEAVRRWVGQLRPHHLLLEDPLRTKIQSFDLLSHDERVEWLVEAKAALERKLAELDEYRNAVSVPFHDIVHDNAVSSVRARIGWIDRTLYRLVKNRSGADLEQAR